MAFCAILDKIDMNHAAPFSIYLLSVVFHYILLYMRHTIKCSELLAFLFCM